MKISLNADIINLLTKKIKQYKLEINNTLPLKIE